MFSIAAVGTERSRKVTEKRDGPITTGHLDLQEELVSAWLL